MNESNNNQQNNNENANNITNNENFQNLNENLSTEEKKESNWYWLIYIIVAIIIFIIILLLLKGCNSIKSNNKTKIFKTNETITNMWNKCVDPIYWYTVDGTGVNGSSINIDSILNNCDTYYNEYKENSSYVSSLKDEDAEFKNYFSKISEQIEIIYPKIKAQKPVSEEATDYEENMEIFYEYQVKLYNLVKEKYSEG